METYHNKSMHQIQISHEIPLTLTEEAFWFNDFDYFLVHLCRENSNYLNWCKQSVALDRDSILDNSIFELGVAFNAKEFAESVKEINPTFYIVPDCLDDSKQTIENYQNFKKEYISNLPGVPMGVVQGKTYDDILTCYRKLVDEGCIYIGISFDMKYFDVTGYGPTFRHRQMTGRQALVNRLMQEGHWRHDLQHHLLGCSLPQEFRWYVSQNITSIRSLDTSNPIVCGMQGLKYNSDLGLQTKPSIKLCELIDAELSDDQLDTIRYNLRSFKKILGRNV